MLSRSIGKLKIVTTLTFLLLILLRLIVVQLRQYPYEPTFRAHLAYSYLDEIYGLSCKDVLMTGVGSSKFFEHDPSGVPKKIVASWLISPAFSWIAKIRCQQGRAGIKGLVDSEQWLLVFCTILGVFAGRFLTGSWVVGLTVGVAIIYRETMTQGIGIVGPDKYLQFLFTLWFASASHFLKTGSLTSLTVVVLSVVCGALFDGAFSGIALGMPVMLLLGFPYRKVFASRILHRLRHRKKIRDKNLSSKPGTWSPNQKENLGTRIAVTIKWMVGQGVPENPNVNLGKNLSRGGLFRSIQAPFGLWVFRKNRWKHLVAGWLIIFIVIVIALSVAYEVLAVAMTGEVQYPLFNLIGTSISPHWISLWVMGIMDPLDINYFISFAVIFVCAVQSPTDGIFSFLESTWMLIITVLCLLFFAFTFDMIDYRLIEHFKKVVEDHGVDMRAPVRQVFLWCEPAFLTIGIAGIYNLIKVADSRLGEA